MTSFFLISVAIATLVVALLIKSALKGQGAYRSRQARANCYRVHEQNLKDLAADHAAGLISTASYENARFEAETRLVADMQNIAEHPPRSANRLWLALGIIAVPVFAFGMYFLVGNLAANNPEAVFVRTGNVAQFVDAVAKLEEKVRRNPDDMDSHWMLARSYRAMGRYEDSVAAFGKAWPAIKDNPTEIALFAGVLAIYRGEFSGKPDELIHQALTLEPENHDALTLAGGSAFQKDDFDGALRHWQKLRALLPAGSEEQQWLDAQINEARKRQAGDATESQLMPKPSGQPNTNMGALPPGHPQTF